MKKNNYVLINYTDALIDKMFPVLYRNNSATDFDHLSEHRMRKQQ